ncbi:MAG: polysaccharide deacetylase family protein [Myxococcales bacterium]|nr:polysaccharide deacetylase family protein [Myxococcales bacterium]
MPTLAERLGFAPTDRIAVIHCDDIGMCRAANDGAFEALRNGPATCGSIMVPCPAFPEAAEWARTHPELDLGIHLTLNAEWPEHRWGPVAGASAVPSLVDAAGQLLPTTLETAVRAKPAEVEIELHAQVDLALQTGIDATHLDTHMGTCFVPSLVEIYAGLAEEYELPVFAVRPDPAELARRGLGAAIDVYVRVLDVLAAANAPVLDAFDDDSLGFAPGEGAAHNERRLARLAPGVTYLICHPARGGAELESIASDAHARDFERTFYGGAAGRRAFEAEGIRTLGMRALRDLMRGGG